MISRQLEIPPKTFQPGVPAAQSQPVRITCLLTGWKFRESINAGFQQLQWNWTSPEDEFWKMSTVLNDILVKMRHVNICTLMYAARFCCVSVLANHWYHVKGRIQNCEKWKEDLKFRVGNCPRPFTVSFQSCNAIPMVVGARRISWYSYSSSKVHYFSLVEQVWPISQHCGCWHENYIPGSQAHCCKLMSTAFGRLEIGMTTGSWFFKYFNSSFDSDSFHYKVRALSGSLQGWLTFLEWAAEPWFYRTRNSIQTHCCWVRSYNKLYMFLAQVGGSMFSKREWTISMIASNVRIGMVWSLLMIDNGYSW